VIFRSLAEGYFLNICCQIQRTDAVTANQNPKSTSASATLTGSLRLLGLCKKKCNVAKVKMKATGEPIFQKLLSGRRREFSMLPDRKSGQSASSISD